MKNPRVETPPSPDSRTILDMPPSHTGAMYREVSGSPHFEDRSTGAHFSYKVMCIQLKTLARSRGPFFSTATSVLPRIAVGGRTDVKVRDKWGKLLHSFGLDGLVRRRAGEGVTFRARDVLPNIARTRKSATNMTMGIGTKMHKERMGKAVLSSRSTNSLFSVVRKDIRL